MAGRLIALASVLGYSHIARLLHLVSGNAQGTTMSIHGCLVLPHKVSCGSGYLFRKFWPAGDSSHHETGQVVVRNLPGSTLPSVENEAKAGSWPALVVFSIQDIRLGVSISSAFAQFGASLLRERSV
jgi:hypothetical protein